MKRLTNFTRGRRSVPKRAGFTLLIWWAFSWSWPAGVFSQGGLPNQALIDSLNQVLKETSNPVHIASAYSELGVALNKVNPDTMVFFSQLALSVIDSYYTKANADERKELDIIRSSSYNNIGYVHSLKGDLDKAIAQYQRALLLQRNSGDLSGAESTLNNISHVLIEQGKLLEALDTYELTRKLCILLKDGKKLGMCLNNIGYVYQTLKDYPKAIRYYRESIQVRQRAGDDRGRGVSYNNIGVIYMNSGKLDSSLYYHRKSLELLSTAQDMMGMANSHLNLGKLYTLMKDTSEAIRELEVALALTEKFQVPKQESAALAGLAKIYASRNQIEKLRQVVPRLERNWRQIGTPQYAIYFADAGIALAEKENDWKRSTELLRLKHAMEDSVASQEIKLELIRRDYQFAVNQEVKDLKLLHAMESKELESKTALETEKRRRIMLVFILATFIAMLLSVAGYLAYRNQLNRQKLVSALLEKKILEKEKADLDLLQKSQQLTGYSLRIAQNGQFLHELDDIMNRVGSEKSNEESIQDMIRELRNKVRINQRREQDWIGFQKQFEGIHPGFVHALKAQYPNLSASEIRLCSLMKLNLNPNEVISLLGITKNTLRSSRYRIHKKMNLPEGQHLSDFLIAWSYETKGQGEEVDSSLSLD